MIIIRNVFWRRKQFWFRVVFIMRMFILGQLKIIFVVIVLVIMRFSWRVSFVIWGSIVFLYVCLVRSFLLLLRVLRQWMQLVLSLQIIMFFIFMVQFLIMIVKRLRNGSIQCFRKLLIKFREIEGMRFGLQVFWQGSYLSLIFIMYISSMVNQKQGMFVRKQKMGMVYLLYILFLFVSVLSQFLISQFKMIVGRRIIILQGRVCFIIFVIGVWQSMLQFRFLWKRFDQKFRNCFQRG